MNSLISEEMSEITQELLEIKSELAFIKATGENTLAECKKTNGRVTKLEDSHNVIKTDLAVLKAVTEEKIGVLNRDVDDIAPKVEDHSSIVSFIKGNWQGISTFSIVILIILEKLKII